MKDSIWITWENQVRNKSMASLLNSELFVLTCQGSRLKRYNYCLKKTLFVLLRKKPKIVFAQNPSIVLIVFLLLLKKFLRYYLISDAHYAGIVAANNNKLFQVILDLCNNCVDLVIVTNIEHYRYIHKLGGRAFVFEDPLPDCYGYDTITDNNLKKVFFICSYDVDEPYKKVFDASDMLVQEGFKIVATGNYKKVNIQPANHQSVEFLGFLPEKDYYKELSSSSVVLDLTENENCLLCGAYEAMAGEKPLITSNTLCLKRYFTSGTVFTDHQVKNIVESVKYAYHNKEELSKQIPAWKRQVLSDQKKKTQAFCSVLKNIVDKGI